MILAAMAEAYERPEFARAPHGWAALAAIALVTLLLVAVFWLYSRETRAGCGPGRRRILAGLRCLVLLGLVAVWLDPVVVLYEVTTTMAHTIVLADVSGSMAVADDGRPRQAAVAHLLTSDQAAWLEALQQRNQTAVYTFGDVVERVWPAAHDVSSTDAVSALKVALRRRADRTDLGQALEAALQDAGGAPLAGVVLITDGNVNRGLSLGQIAELLESRHAPAYVVGVGALVEPPNVRVVDFSAPPSVLRGDPFELRARVVLGGPSQANTTASLLRHDGTGFQPLMTRRLQLQPDQPVDLTLPLSAQQAGVTRYRLVLDPVAGESLLLDNQRECDVTVMDQRLRVLLVAGRPSYEYRYLTRLLERDQSVEVSCWLQSADPEAVRDGDVVLRELPRDAQTLFSYDVILLLDPNPDGLDASLALLLRRFVGDLGGGLLWQAGNHYATRLCRDGRFEDLVTMFPVAFDLEASGRAVAGTGRRALPLAVPPAGRTHPVMALPGDEGADVFRRLPGVWWHMRTLRVKPLASVLLETTPPAASRPDVLLALQPFGAGRTAVLGFESTWRWRSRAEPLYERFWTRLIRYLAQPRREGLSPRGTIVLDRAVIRPGDYVRIEVRVLDRSFVPWHAAELKAVLEHTDGVERELRLAPVAERAGWFSGHFTADFTGPALIRVPLPGSADQGEQQTLVRRFRVESSDVELAVLRQQQEALRALAENTGGRYFELSKAAGLPDHIADARRVRTSRTGQRALWDRWWIVVGLVALLAVEWTVRRRSHLL